MYLWKFIFPQHYWNANIMNNMQFPLLALSVDIHIDKLYIVVPLLVAALNRGHPL